MLPLRVFITLVVLCFVLAVMSLRMTIVGGHVAVTAMRPALMTFVSAMKC